MKVEHLWKVTRTWYVWADNYYNASKAARRLIDVEETEVTKLHNGVITHKSGIQEVRIKNDRGRSCKEKSDPKS